jgi:hypothetical protein
VRVLRLMLDANGARAMYPRPVRARMKVRVRLQREQRAI